MTEKNKTYLIYIIVFLFVILNAISLYKEFYFLTIFPIALAVLCIGIFSLDKLLIIITALTPLSISLNEIGIEIPFDLFIPTEPLILLVLLLFVLKSLYTKSLDKKIINHPLTIVIAINLLWIFITSLTSTDILVSLKFFLVRLWYLVSFYYLAIILFKNAQNIYRFLWAYIISFSIVIIYSIYNQNEVGFSNINAAHFVMEPFYNDHTSYGAIIAMFIPVLLGLIINEINHFRKWSITFFILILFITALLLSYTRAAWISLIGAFLVWISLMMRLRLTHILTILFSISLIFILFQNSFIMKMEENKKNQRTNIAEHAETITNITTDDSNKERINRWKCALKMFVEKPIFGWGPGTYMFKYAPYQLSYDRTSISTNRADGGNAHSEYIGPLAESGILGTLTFIAIVITSIVYGFKLSQETKNKRLRITVIACFIGLTTYFIHGSLNNFLDTDKAAVPFWGFIAILIATDLYHKNDSNN